MLTSRARGLIAGAILTAALVAGALSALLPPGRAALHTALLMPAFFTQVPNLSALPGASAVRRSDCPLSDRYPGAMLHIIRPATGRHPTLVITLGIDPAPPDDPRVVRLLRGFARSGITAILVESPALTQERLQPDAPALLVEAVTQAAHQPGVDPRQIGLLGFSVGGSLALLAAANPAISGRLRLVEAFGAYDDLHSVARATVTHRIRVAGRERAWQPDDLTVLVIRANVIDGLELDSDRRALRQALLDHSPAAGAEPPGLSPDAATVYALLTAPDTASFDADYAALPQSQRDRFALLSPARVLPELRARVFLMVDEGDPLIPFTQSRAIASGLRAAGNTPYFSEFDIFRHVDPTRGGNPVILGRDLLRLFLHASAVLGRL